ncbi:MAG TPA: hypothetical protein VFI62_13925 [Burkholderiales bacterium]|nr:hypothetical protein [Burkholderiales bacterium]
MSVLFTLVVLALLGGWALAVYRRLVSLRTRVTLAWKKLETDQTNEAIRTVYNKHAQMYNEALGGFPANIIAMLAGLKPARRF